MNTISKNVNELLLKQFNNRNAEAFSHIYLLLYDDVYYFTSNIFRNRVIDPDDVIQDVFLNLWENKKQQFNGVNNIKAYLIVAIKNRYINFIQHQKTISKHQSDVLHCKDYFVAEMVEMEVFSILREAEQLLPEECAKVFTEYINGLSAKEIASKLEKSEFTVYKQKNHAIKILKEKMSSDKILIIICLIADM